MESVKTTINGQTVEVERDRWALDVAREMGYEIPTLCHHPALEPYGACRLCVVEVTKGKWTWLTTSCDLPIRQGLSIRTDSDTVRTARRMALELLWTQAPDAELIHEMAGKLGLEKPRFAPRHKHGKCILCGLCVRVCRDLMGRAAIGFSSRGVVRRVGSPLDEQSDRCIGCKACVAVCPTGHIQSVDNEGNRLMRTWKTELPLAYCHVCEKPFAPSAQLDYIKSKLGTKLSFEAVCDGCRRTRTVQKFVVTSEKKAK